MKESFAGNLVYENRGNQMHHIEIFSPNDYGWASRVFLDGKELTGCRSVTAQVSTEEITTVTLVLEAKVDWKTEAVNVQTT